MIEQFLQRKVASLLDSYIEFEKLKLMTAQGMTIKNSKIKAKLVEHLSQIMKIPLQHVSGSINSLTFSKPWEKLFFLIMNSPIKIAIEGVKIKVKLKSNLDQNFLLKIRQNQIERLTQGLFNPLQSSNSYINQKLKEYFLSTFILQIKNFCLEIEIDLRQRVIIIIKIDSLKLKKQDKKVNDSEHFNLQVQGAGVYYRVGADIEKQLISPTKIQFQRIKNEKGPQNKRISTKNLKIQKLDFNINNINYGDMARILLLINWHRSFDHIPYQAWKIKPLILSQCRPYAKFVYCAQLIMLNFRQNCFRRQLILRRTYINLYTKILANLNQIDILDRQELQKLEKSLPSWKIISYRFFCIMLMKNQIQVRRKEQRKKIEENFLKKPEKQNNLMNISWFSNWLITQKNREQLQQQFLQKVNALQNLPSDIESIFHITVDRIRLKLIIVTNFGQQPFLSLVGIDCSYKFIEHFLEKKWEKNIHIVKCKVQYQKKSGHCERYRNFISQCKQHLSASEISSNLLESDDEFSDIANFLEVNYRNDSECIIVKLLPFDLFINYEVFQKFAILMDLQKLSKITNMKKFEEAYLTKVNPWTIVQKQKENILLEKRQRTQEIDQSFNKDRQSNANKLINRKNLIQTQLQSEIFKNRQIQQQFILLTALNIIIPMNLRDKLSPQLVIQIGQLSLSKKGIRRQLSMKSVLFKVKLPKKQNQQEINYQHIVNYLQPKIQQKIIIRKFNFKLQMQNHLQFDKFSVILDPIFIEIPSQQHVFEIISLVFLHIPKKKQSKIRQYYRRKQSIGQQFMDACQNLNEHLTKSILMSSEKLSKKSVIHNKKSKQLTIVVKSITITDKDNQLLIGNILVNINEIGYDMRTISSHNNKIRLTIHNLRKLVNDVQAIKLHLKKESIKKGFALQNNVSNENSKMVKGQNQFSELNIEIVILLKKKRTPAILLSLNGINYSENKELNYKGIDGSLRVAYDQQIQGSQRFIKIPFIQKCEIFFVENNRFNHLERSVTLNTLNINIKPSLFKILAQVIKDYHVEEEAWCVVTNGTINTLKIKKSQTNYYSEYKFNQRFTTDNHHCEMNLFGNKMQLQFTQHQEQEIPKMKIQCIDISENNFLINKEVSPNQFILQSNIRILNHQDKTLWMKITESSSQIITPQDYETTRFRLNQLAKTPKKQKQIDLTQKIAFSSDHIQQNFFSKTLKSHQFYSPQFSSKKISTGKNLSIPLKPKEKIHILIDSNDHKFLQIYDQGINFTQIQLSELFEATEIILKSQQSDQNQFLVIRSEISNKQGINGCIYTFHIYSPIYIVNKTPWQLQYRLSQEININYDQQRGRLGRRRSFQVVPLKKIPILSAEKIRIMHYNQIQSMKLMLNKCEREIVNMVGIIGRIKDKRSIQHEGQFFKQQQLISLKNNKKEIQLILCLQFSPNILKIKLYPQFIFINMTKELIKYKIQQDQITYPQIVLQHINFQPKDNQSYQSKQKRLKFNTTLNQYINLTDQKLKQRDALKQLFENFENHLEIFTGKIQQSEKIKRKMIYNQQFEHSFKNKSLLKSHRGYISDYGSDGEMREEITRQSEQILQDENIIIYSEKEFIFFKRVLKIEQYFSIVLFTPTIHIINKSQAYFYAKSSCQNLVLIPKQSHNYIQTNTPSIHLQASFEEGEISLNEWIKIDLNSLGTIYYSKDMIQKHGSGYQSKEYSLRKKKMKKTPKIFYRILLCKYERGQKILIQQSQYPPFSFINNTLHSLKIEQLSENFIEQLKDKGDMGQYAPKNPYHKPNFRLSIAEHYQYRVLKTFDVDEKQVFNLEKGIILAIEQYKDKIIINIKDDKENANLKISQIQLSEINEINLEEMKKFFVSIQNLNIVVMNNWNRELNCNLIEKISFTYQNKNHKNYYSLEIANFQGYDYMEIEPNFIFKRKKKDKVMLGILHKQNNTIEDFLNINVVVNYHKNAVIVEKCQIKLVEMVFYISADLILAYVKNFYHSLYYLHAVHKYYSINHQNKKDKKKSSFLHKTFIVQSLNWYGTSLKIQTRNIFIMETFLNKSYEKWLVKFINWLGDIKPIGFKSFRLENQQITLWKLKKQLDINKKKAEIGALLMDYPISQLKEFLSFLLDGDQVKTLREKANVLYKIVKYFEYIASFTLSLNENLKNQVKSYNEIFIEMNKQNQNIIDKMINFEYCQWRYKTSNVINKLSKKIKRLERYNTRNEILPFDQFKSQIKLALDSYLTNKIYKQIQKVYRINQEFILSIVQQQVVVYSIKNNEWIIIKVQFLLNIQREDNSLAILYWQKQENIEQVAEQKSTNIKEILFKDCEINAENVIQLRQCIKHNILAFYY